MAKRIRSDREKVKTICVMGWNELFTSVFSQMGEMVLEEVSWDFRDTPISNDLINRLYAERDKVIRNLCFPAYMTKLNEYLAQLIDVGVEEDVFCEAASEVLNELDLGGNFKTEDVSRAFKRLSQGMVFGIFDDDDSDKNSI